VFRGKGLAKRDAGGKGWRALRLIPATSELAPPIFVKFASNRALVLISDRLSLPAAAMTGWMAATSGGARSIWLGRSFRAKMDLTPHHRYEGYIGNLPINSWEKPAV
jgi:hypothetical protein